MSARCPYCATEVTLSSEVWCPSCGKDLLAAPPIATPAPVATPDTTETSSRGAPVPAVSGWACTAPGCGVSDIPVGAPCPYCGGRQGSDSAVVGVIETIRLVSPLVTLVLAGIGPWVLGRHSSDTPALASLDRVSRRHASLAIEGGRVVVRDLGSTNGTYVNDIRVTDVAAVRNGDRIGLGRTVTLTAQLITVGVADEEPR